jgi:hypothetical protein
MSRLAIIFSLLFVTPAWAETVLYCQEEISTGILKPNKSWETVMFDLDRHTVKFDEKNMTLKGVSGNLGMECRAPCSFMPDAIYCFDRIYGTTLFVFDKESLRFSLYKPTHAGWVENSKDPDSNHMSHGTCQKF